MNYLQSNLATQICTTKFGTSTFEHTGPSEECIDLLTQNTNSGFVGDSKCAPSNKLSFNKHSLPMPRAIRNVKRHQQFRNKQDSSLNNEDMTELQKEIEERNEALDELSSILAESSSCPSIVPSGKLNPSLLVFELTEIVL